MALKLGSLRCPRTQAHPCCTHTTAAFPAPLRAHWSQQQLKKLAVRRCASAERTMEPLPSPTSSRDEPMLHSSQQQQKQPSSPPAPPEPLPVVTASMIEELEAVTTQLPRQEARLEVLAAWVGAAVAFGAGIWRFQGAEKAQEYFAGYLLEQALSVDNLFVFVLVFKYFQTPEEVQPKVLSYGIITAAVLRLTMIMLGTELIQSFRPVLIAFAGILLYTSWGLLTAGDEEQDEDLTDNAVVKLCRRVLPVSDLYDGDRFFTVMANGVKVATPLLLTLSVIEISDVLFAVDSIPAVFGVTLDPFIVYTSNMFAILSLRSLYGFVSTVMQELKYLDKAIALVLGFIGSKMLLEFVSVDIPTDTSLVTVGLLLAGGVGASLLLPEPGGEGKAKH